MNKKMKYNRKNTELPEYLIKELSETDKKQKEMGMNTYHRKCTREGIIDNYIDELNGVNYTTEEMREQTRRSLEFDLEQRNGNRLKK
jgi:hypothetical protein